MVRRITCFPGALVKADRSDADVGGRHALAKWLRSFLLLEPQRKRVWETFGDRAGRSVVESIACAEHGGGIDLERIREEVELGLAASECGYCFSLARRRQERWSFSGLGLWSVQWWSVLPQGPSYIRP